MSTIKRERILEAYDDRMSAFIVRLSSGEFGFRGEPPTERLCREMLLLYILAMSANHFCGGKKCLPFSSDDGRPIKKKRRKKKP